MVKLGNISGKIAVKAFKKLGYSIARQTGSHVILKHQNRPTLTIPNHKELAPGLFKGNYFTGWLECIGLYEEFKINLSTNPCMKRNALPCRKQSIIHRQLAPLS